MRMYLKQAAITLLATLGSVSSAFGAAGHISPTVTALATSVTFRDSGPATYASFGIKWENDGGNTINNIAATFTTQVVDDNGNNPWNYKATLYLDGNALPEGCKASETSDTEFTCNLKQLKELEKFPSDGSSVIVFYKAPIKNPKDDSDLETYKIKIVASFVYAEGTSGSNPVGQPSTLSCADDPEICPSISLGTDNPTFVRSSAPKTGLTLPTGTNFIPAPFAAQVVIPALKFVFEKPAEVDVKPPIDGGCNTVLSTNPQLLSCQKADVTIEEFGSASSGGYLKVMFRFAADQLIGKPVRPELIIVNYRSSPDSNFTNANAFKCVNFGTENAGPRDDVPACVANRIYYKNKSVPGYTEALQGVVELQFIVGHNGQWFSF